MNDDYERIGNNMYCTEKSKPQPCAAQTIDDYSVPSLTHGQTKSVTQTKSSG